MLLGIWLWADHAGDEGCVTGYKRKMTEDPWWTLTLDARLQWALSPELPEVYRPFLLTEQWMQTRCYFARRADLRLDEVAVLAADGDYVIRLCIAKRPDLTAEQVGVFCQDHAPNVRYAIARNPLLTQVQRMPQIPRLNKVGVAHWCVEPVLARGCGLI